LEWNYTSEAESSTGYEDVLDKLKTYTGAMYVSATDEEKERIVNEVFKIYRGKNIYPIIYFNEDGIYREIRKCVDKDVGFDDVLDLKCNQGQSLCRFMFPNVMNVQIRSHKNMWVRFFDDLKLKRAIELCLRFEDYVSPSRLRGAFQLVCGGVASCFKVMNAKALYERYCPPDGVIYDFACGFGGRMLGALSSRNDYTYIGVEPCKETYTHLNQLGRYIEHVTEKKDSYRLFCTGSEDFMYGENTVDFAFSSPPYFNLEKYSDEPTQCYNRFPVLEDWFAGYVRPTIESTYKMLKPNTYYGVNIANFRYYSDITEYVDMWIKMAEEAGFKYEKKMEMKVRPRFGNGHEDGDPFDNGEGIYIFKTIK
jgi:hypothetical protein